jgi:SOS-response transcriptional repressor LexA
LLHVKIAAGDFSPEQWKTECNYVELPDHFTAKPGFFVAQVCGESMNRRIPNGSWCLFREPSVGTRDGKVVLVQSRSVQDHDNGGQFTVKIYRSEKVASEELWSHQVISLEPDSFDSRFKALVLTGDEQTDLRVVGEFVAVVS